MADASVTLGLNAAELYTELNAAVSKYQQGLNRMATSSGGAVEPVNRLTQGHDRLFTSSHRVANRVGELARVFTSGGSAADVMAVGIEGLGRSLNLPLGILAAIAAAGVLVQQIYKSQAEVAKLNAEMAALGAGNVQNARFQSLETLQKQAEEAKKKLEELRKAHDGLIQRFLRFEGISASDFGAKTPKEAKEKFEEQKRAERQALKRAREGEVTKETQKVEIAETKINTGDIAAERAKINQARQEAVNAAQATEKNKQGKEVPVLDAKARKQAIDNANRQYAVENAALNHKEAALKREVDLENELATIKASGYNVDERSAAAKLKYAKAALDAANAEDTPKKAAAVHAAAAEFEIIARERAKSARTAADETAELQAQLAGYDETASVLKEMATIHERILEAQKNGDAVLASELDKQRQIRNEIEKQKAAGGNTATQRERKALNERREVRDENKREKELKDELSRTGDPKKREEIKDELEDIQLKRQERAEGHEKERLAAEAAAKKAAEDKQKEDEARAQQQEQDRASKEKETDEGEVKRFGRVLSPDERARVKGQDDEAARQKNLQDQEQQRQQDLSDSQEAANRGLTVEQLRNEREAKSRQQQAGEGQTREGQAGAADSGKKGTAEDKWLKVADKWEKLPDEIKKALTNQ